MEPARVGLRELHRNTAHIIDRVVKLGQVQVIEDRNARPPLPLCMVVPLPEEPDEH
jgi:hypothetical protein